MMYNLLILKHMLNQGTYQESKQFNFGIKHKGNLYEVKLRFTEEIANYINTKMTGLDSAPDLFITDTSNKGTRTIYGHCAPPELDSLIRIKNRAMGERLISQGLALINK